MTDYEKAKERAAKNLAEARERASLRFKDDDLGQLNFAFGWLGVTLTEAFFSEAMLLNRLRDLEARLSDLEDVGEDLELEEGGE